MNPEHLTAPAVRGAFAETVAWCSAQTFGTARERLRTPALRPRSELGSFIDETLRTECVADLIVARSALISSRHGVHPVTGIVADGKVLIYVPAENVSDGASEAASKGFFDVDDCPPWDTWFSFAEGELLSWVPSEFVSLVQQGIDVNPVDCIGWADDAVLHALTN